MIRAVVIPMVVVHIRQICQLLPGRQALFGKYRVPITMASSLMNSVRVNVLVCRIQSRVVCVRDGGFGDVNFMDSSLQLVNACHERRFFAASF